MKKKTYFSFGQQFVPNVPGIEINLPKRKGRGVSCLFRARVAEGGEGFIPVALSLKMPHLFNQFFFQRYWLLLRVRLVMRSWLVLRMRPPLDSLATVEDTYLHMLGVLDFMEPRLKKNTCNA